MAKYFNSEFVANSFKRLSSRNHSGKAHLERSSALLYFLAFDGASKYLEKDVLDLNPDTSLGKINRKQIELEFTKLVLVEHSYESFKQVSELGKIDIGGTPPEKRISSNFFTVPLKRASAKKEADYYPHRPSFPLLEMGFAATGLSWGVKFHVDWTKSFPHFFSEVKSPTPFLDLAIFVCRDCKIDDAESDLVSVTSNLLAKRFTKKMNDYWVSKIEKERVLVTHIENPFIDQHMLFTKAFEENSYLSNKYNQMKTHELIERILYLEKLLHENNIKFD